MAGGDTSLGDALAKFVHASAARAPQEIARDRKAKECSGDSGKMASEPAEEPPLPAPEVPPSDEEEDVGAEVR